MRCKVVLHSSDLTAVRRGHQTSPDKQSLETSWPRRLRSPSEAVIAIRSRRFHKGRAVQPRKDVYDFMDTRGRQGHDVVPPAWRAVAIGAIFLRTLCDGAAFTERRLAMPTSACVRYGRRHGASVVQRSSASAPRRAATGEQRTDRSVNLACLTRVESLKQLLDDSTKDHHDALPSQTAGTKHDRLAGVARTVIQKGGKDR